MPMPVSITDKMIACPRSRAAVTRISPCSVNLRALEIRLRRIWATLLSSVKTDGRPASTWKRSLTLSVTSSGRSIPRRHPPAQRAKQLPDETPREPDLDFARLDFRQIEQIVDQVGQARGGGAD